MGCSVIDIAAVSYSCLDVVRSFKVVNHTGSDHLPIEVCLLMNNPDKAEGEGDQLLQLLPKLKWSQKDDLLYAAKINNNIAKFGLAQAGFQKDINSVVEIIYKSASTNNVRNHVSNFKNKEPWFDYECLAARRRKFNLLNRFRKTNCAETKLEYMEAVKHFKSVCKSKQKNYFDRIVINLSEISDAKKCWQAINSFKRRPERIVGNIKPQEFLNYFNNLLNPPLLAAGIKYAEPLIRNESMDAAFTMSELKAVVSRAQITKPRAGTEFPMSF